MKKDKNKKPVNKWKLTAIISLVINGIVALLLAIGLGNTPKASVKVGAYNEVYDTSKIVLTTQNINYNNDYYLYFDWVNQSVNGHSELFYFPISNSVEMPSFDLRLGPLNRDFTVDNFNYRELIIENNSEGIHFQLYGGDTITGTTGFREIMRIRFSIEPYSNYLEVWRTSSSTWLTEEVVTNFKNLFDGTINISSHHNPFVLGYFSQYSVQNLEVGLKADSNIALNQTDFSPYQFGIWSDAFAGLDYSFIQSTLIHSASPLLSDQQEYVLMPLLNGSFYAKDQNSAILVGVWKEIYWPILPSASATPTYYDLLYNGQRLDKSNGHYYYLDSINFYNVGAEELGEVVYSVTSIDYQQEYQWTNGYCYYSTKLQQSVLNPLVIRKVNLYPSQRIQWINFSNIFNITNHFYFGDGIIVNPSIGNDNNINGSEGAIGNVFILIKNGFESLMPLLSLMILPNISLGMLVFLPLVGTIILVIIKLVKR